MNSTVATSTSKSHGSESDSGSDYKQLAEDASDSDLDTDDGAADVEDEPLRKRPKKRMQHSSHGITSKKRRRAAPLQSKRRPALPLAPNPSVQSPSRPLAADLTMRRTPPPPPFVSSERDKAITEVRLEVGGDNKDQFVWRVKGETIRICCHDQPLSETSDLVDSSCAALSFLGGYYSPICKAIVFRTRGHGEPTSNGSLIPFADFLKHLQGDKRSVVRSRLQRSKQTLSVVIDHIRRAFALPIDQTLQDLAAHIDTFRLPEPLPWLGDPEEAVQCLSCKGWYNFRRMEKGKKQLGVLQYHWRERKRNESKNTCEEKHSKYPSWTLAAFEYKGAESRPFRFRMADDWDSELATSLPPPQPLPHSTLPSRYTPPAYMTDLGWWQTFEAYGKSAEDLQPLRGLPLLSRAKKYQSNSEPQRIELGLCVLYKEIMPYLLHAEKKINDAHVSLRSDLTLGTKARFRKFKNVSSFRSYRIQLSQLFILPLRRHLWSRRLPPEKLGKCNFPMSSEQDQVLLDIYNLLLTSSFNPETQDIEIDRPALVSSMHKFLALILVEEHDQTDKVSGLLEHVTVFLSITPEDKAISASILTSVAARWQRALLSIFIHCAFLNSFDGTYEPEQLPDSLEEILETVPKETNKEPDESGDESGDGDEPDINEREQEQEPDSDDERDGDADQVDGTETLISLMQEGPIYDGDDSDPFFVSFPDEPCLPPLIEKTSTPLNPEGQSQQVPQENSVHNFIKNHKLYISPFDGTVVAPYAYGRVKGFWRLVKPFADQERGKVELQWDDSSQKFDLIWSKVRRTIALAELRNIVHSSLANLERCWSEVLPGGLHHADFQSFSVRDIKDNPGSSDSLFDIPENVSLFAEFIEKIKGGLLERRPSSSRPFFTSDSQSESDGECDTLPPPSLVTAGSTKINKKNSIEYLERTLRLQAVILLLLVLTCGITARAWQIAALQYRTTTDSIRNIRLYKGELLITNPQAKQNDKRMYAAFWVLPPVLAKFLLLYLGVIRPIQIWILEETLDIPADQHKSHIFVHMTTRRKQSYLFSMTDVNDITRKSDLQMELRPLRHAQIGIVKRHFPDLMRSAQSIGESPCDRQSQHTGRTTRQCYAIDEMEHVTGYSTEDCQEQLAVSHAFHYLWCLIPSYAKIRAPFLEKDWDKNRMHALWVARDLVIGASGYNLGVLSKEHLVKQIEDILLRRPFLPSLSSPSPPTALGDDVLVRTTAALVYGEIRPPGWDYYPVHGYNEEIIGNAIVLILVALEELSNGERKLFEDLTMISQQMYAQTNNAIAYIKEFKRLHGEIFHEFCTLVLRRARDHVPRRHERLRVLSRQNIFSQVQPAEAVYESSSED